MEKENYNKEQADMAFDMTNILKDTLQTQKGATIFGEGEAAHYCAKLAFEKISPLQSIISEQKAEITEYRQRIEENVKSIESMLHHNSVQKAEIERLRKAGDELSESHQKAMASLGTYGEHPLIESWYRKAINNWNTLTKKEGNNG